MSNMANLKNAQATTFFCNRLNEKRGWARCDPNLAALATNKTQHFVHSDEEHRHDNSLCHPSKWPSAKIYGIRVRAMPQITNTLYL